MGFSRDRERVFTRNSQVRPGSGTALEPIVVSSATARVARDHGGRMNDSTTPRGRTARWAGAAGLLAAGAIAGGIRPERPAPTPPRPALRAAATPRRPRA